MRALVVVLALAACGGGGTKSARVGTGRLAPSDDARRQASERDDQEGHRGLWPVCRARQSIQPKNRNTSSYAYMLGSFLAGRKRPSKKNICK